MLLHYGNSGAVTYYSYHNIKDRNSTEIMSSLNVRIVSRDTV